MASHPRFSPSSTSSSSKCPPRPRASRDQHPPCPSPFLSSAVRSIILTSGRNNIGQPPPTHLVPIHTLPLLYKHDAPAACKSSPKSVFAKKISGAPKSPGGRLRAPSLAQSSVFLHPGSPFLTPVGTPDTLSESGSIKSSSRSRRQARLRRPFPKT